MLRVGVVLLWIAAAMPPARAQYEVAADHPSPLSLRALVEVRVADHGKVPSWRDRGAGKARYGGRRTSRGFDRVVRLEVAQLALELGGTLPLDIIPRVQINWDSDLEGDGDWPLLIEAYLRRQWGDWDGGWGIQAGVMNIPFSLEHEGPAWTPLYTLTPSALNTWLWEEIRSVGLEADWWRLLPRGFRVGFLAGTGFGPDQLGRLLALRGWVLSDFLSGLNSELPLLDVPGESVSVFDEMDHRPLVYGWATVAEPGGRAELKAGYFDHLGNQDRAGVWETRFGTVGAVLHPIGRVDLVVQYLTGEALRPGNDSRFDTVYALVSVHHRGHRISIRYDDFQIDDLDGPPSTEEDGNAITIAYLFELGLHHRFGVEYMWIDSNRARSFPGDPADDGWQLSYRFRY